MVRRLARAGYEVAVFHRGRTQAAKPQYDPHILRRFAAFTEATWGLPPEALAVREEAVGAGVFQEHPCRA